MRHIIPLLAFAAPAIAQETPPPFASFDLASEAVLADPHDLTLGPDGRLYVADKFGARIAVFDPDTLELIEMLGEGILPGVHDISFGTDGRVAVAVTGAGAVALYPNIEALRLPPETGVSAPNTEGALLHSNGDLYAMASGIGALVRYRGAELIAATDGHPGAHDVAQGLDGSIWVADTGRARLVQFSPSLKVMTILDDAKYGFIGPRYLDVDDFGRLVVADQDAHRVLMIDPLTGDLIGVIGDGSPGVGPGKFDDPEGVAVRGNSYYFSDSDNNRVVKYVVVVN